MGVHASRVGAALVAVVALALSTPARAQTCAPPEFIIRDLQAMLPNAFDAESSRAFGINERGVVAGSYRKVCPFPPCPNPFVVLYDTDADGVETPPNSDPKREPDFELGAARRINDADQVVGYTLTGLFDHIKQATYWDRPGGAIELLHAGESAALDINEANQVAGKLRFYHAVFWENDAMIEVPGDVEPTGCPGVTTDWDEPFSALGINDAGLVVGGGDVTGQCHNSCNPQGGDFPAYKWSANDGEFTGLCDSCLGECRGDEGCGYSGFQACSVSTAYGVNDEGTIVGEAIERIDAGTLGEQIAFWLPPNAHGNAMHYIGRLPGDTRSRALAVNGQRQVVGVSSASGLSWGGSSDPLSDFEHYGDFLRRPFLFEARCGALYDLESLIVGGDMAGAWTLLEASDVNDRGENVGWGKVDGFDRAYLLTPVAGPSCPEDMNGDGMVGIFELLALFAAWGTDPGGPPDFDGDGNVGITDLLALFAAWGPCP